MGEHTIFLRQLNRPLASLQIRARHYELRTSYIFRALDDRGEIVGVSLRAVVETSVDGVGEVDAYLLCGGGLAWDLSVQRCCAHWAEKKLADRDVGRRPYIDEARLVFLDAVLCCGSSRRLRFVRCRGSFCRHHPEANGPNLWRSFDNISDFERLEEQARR